MPRRSPTTLAQWQQLWQSLGVPADYIRRAEQRIQTSPSRLVVIGRAPKERRMLRLAPAAARAWRQMNAAANNDSVTLIPLSAYRRVARQTRIIRRKLAAGQTIATILRVNAIPGCSEHHTGRALDFGAPDHLQLETSFARTREFRWLKKHATKFGFHLSYPRGNRQGITYEPWHWCWTTP